MHTILTPATVTTAACSARSRLGITVTSNRKRTRNSRLGTKLLVALGTDCTLRTSVYQSGSWHCLWLCLGELADTEGLSFSASLPVPSSGPGSKGWSATPEEDLSTDPAEVSADIGIVVCVPLALCSPDSSFCSQLLSSYPKSA